MGAIEKEIIVNEEQIRNELKCLKKLYSTSDLIDKLKLYGLSIDASKLSRILTKNNPEEIKPELHAIFFKAINELKENYANKYHKKNNEEAGLKRTYYNSVKNKLQQKLNGKTPLKYFSDQYNILEDEVTIFLSALPGIIFSSFSDKFNPNNISKLVEYSSEDVKLITENEVTRFISTNNKKTNLKKIEASVLGHALSPYSDLFALYLELGRYKRICSIFKITNPYILLTDTDWALLNYSVLELQETKQIFDIKQNLENCRQFRKELYKQLGFDDNLLDIKPKYKVQSITKKDINSIEKESEEFEKYSELLKDVLDKIEFENQQLNIPSLIKSIKDASIKDKLQILELSIVNDLKNLYIIYTVNKYFHRTDKNTFLYSLLQRYNLHDPKYAGVLKIGVESEKKFDFAFAKMDAYEDSETRKMIGLYFSHYFFEKGFTVIPYTFPSGILKNKLPKINDAISKVILIYDFSTEVRRNKVRDLIKKIEIEQLGIQISDLFSFINYFFKNDNSKVWNHIERLFDKYGYKEIWVSWTKYRDDESIIEEFQRNMFSTWYDTVEIPYYYYPYILAMRCRETDNMEISFRSFSYDLIILTMENVYNQIPVEEWK